jgi:hypothetical protein
MFGESPNHYVVKVLSPTTWGLLDRCRIGTVAGGSVEQAFDKSFLNFLRTERVRVSEFNN